MLTFFFMLFAKRSSEPQFAHGNPSIVATECPFVNRYN
jgi:hypothetical protein